MEKVKTINDLDGFVDICNESVYELSAKSGQCWDSGATETGYAIMNEKIATEQNENRAEATVGLSVSKS